MKRTAAIACIVSLLLYSCTQNKPASHIPVVGEPIDSIAIGQDTLQQKSIESSYEYAQTLIVSPKLAYDVRAYGGPASLGEYCIIRRGADNKPDTVVQEKRLGSIENAFSGDLNHNGKEEIYVVFGHPSTYVSVCIKGFEFDKNGAKTAIDFGSPRKEIIINLEASSIDSAKSHIDSIYSLGDRLIRTELPEKRGDLKIYWYRAYKLEGTKLVLERRYGYGIDRNYKSNKK